MAKTQKLKETITPSDDVIAQAVAEGQAIIAEGKTKVEAAMAIYRHRLDSPQDIVIADVIEDASLTITVHNTTPLPPPTAPRICKPSQA